MIYVWCMALTIWLTCTGWLLNDTRHKLDNTKDEIAMLKARQRAHWRRINGIEEFAASTIRSNRPTDTPGLTRTK